MQQTTIPLKLSMICNGHILGMGKVVRWLEDLGIKIYHKPHILNTTRFNIHIRHSNDYVEMGPLDADPEGKMFYCYTSQVVEFDVPYKLITKVGQALKNHRGISKDRIADNIDIATDVTNQFVMKRHISADDLSWEKCKFSIEFRVHHTFNQETSIDTSTEGHKNTRPFGGGRVHKVIRADSFGHVVPEHGERARDCDRFHMLDSNPGGGWYLRWTETDKPITCKLCLRNYWPDGRRRVY